MKRSVDCDRVPAVRAGLLAACWLLVLWLGWPAAKLAMAGPGSAAPLHQVISRGEAAGPYQAFPDACRLTNGDILCVFYAGYGHVSRPNAEWPKGGRISMVRSSDEGRTWTRPEVLFDDELDNRDPHIAQMSDGTLVCSFFSSPGTGTQIVRSADGGKTWEKKASLIVPGWGCSAPVREMPDGSRILGIYYERDGKAWGGVTRSTDAGKTWSAPIAIGQGSGLYLDAETDVIRLKDGTLYAALRGGRGAHMYEATSRDMGITWSAVRDMGFNAHCPHFTRLSTGEILLSHRLPSTSLHVSRDEGRSWQGPYLIDTVGGAYPATVELKDKTVLAIYYEEGPGSAIRAARLRVKPDGIQRLPLAAQASQGRLSGLLENEDCTNFFYFQDFPAGKAGEIVDRYVDVLAGAGVTVLMCNTNARRTNYRSGVWEAFWDGYDPNGPDDQPFLAAVAKDHRKVYRKLIGNMLEVHRQGVDYPARVIQRCRQRGISPWISLRMNDVHENNNLDHPFHSPLWRKPELFRQGHPGYYARALDYAHAEVRDHYRALIAETLARYDVDGLELDFLREPYLFSAGKEQEGRQILTAWLREIRKLAREAAVRRGHEVKLGVRVPSCPDTSLGLGLDAPAWAREGLVDLVVASPRWATLEFNMPLGKWRELLGDRVTLAGGLDVNYRPRPDAPARLVTTEDATGAAAAVLCGGADVVYLFNYFQHGHPQWPIPEYQRMLKSFASLDALSQLPRRHAVTYRDVTVPGEQYQPPLPASGKDVSLAMSLGRTPPAGWQAEATIEVAAGRAGAASPSVSVNGVAGTLRSDTVTKSGNRVLTYSIPQAALPGRNQDTLAIQAAEAIKVLRVEVRLHPAG